jgi:hypothetical protein
VVRFYRLVRLVIDLLVLRGRRDRSKDIEILVLRQRSPSCNARSRVRASSPTIAPC